LEPYTSGLISPSEVFGSTYNVFGTGVGITVGVVSGAGLCEQAVIRIVASRIMKIVRRI
jgi:hypothetical protein